MDVQTLVLLMYTLLTKPYYNFQIIPNLCKNYRSSSAY